jgi:hypothetical protein
VQTEFEVDEPGRYVLRLEADDGVRAAVSDPVVVEAVPPQPMVPVRLSDPDGTTATQAVRSIRVGDRVFRSVAEDPPGRGDCPAAGEYPVVNVVVLDRRSLGFRRHDVLCSSRTDLDRSGRQMREILDGLTSRDLVLAKVLPYAGPPRELLLGQFRRIGRPDDLRTTRFGLIGVPGMGPGQASVNDYRPPGTKNQEGDLTGYLTQALDGNYTFVAGALEAVPPEGPHAGDPVQVDTRSPASSPGQNVVRVGGVDVPSQDIPAGQGGFHLVILDSDRLGVALNETFVTTGGASNVTEGVSALTDAITRNAVTGRIVSLVAIREPGAEIRGSLAAPWRALFTALTERLGATPHAVWTLGTPRARPTYGLLTRVGSGQAPVEMSDLFQAGATGRIRAVMTQNTSQRYGIDLADSGGERILGVYELAGRPLEPWPLAETPEQRAALRWLSRRADNTDDLRTAYWLQTYDDGVWSGPVLAALQSAEYPGPAAGFEPETFRAARVQLIMEVGWLLRVRSYIRNVGEPYAQSGLSSWAYLNQIAQQVDEGTQAPTPDPNQNVLISWARFTGEALALADKFGAGGAVGKFTALYKFALAFARTQLGGPRPDLENAVPATTARLGVDLAKGIGAAQDNARLVQSVIVGDYGKLRELARLGQCNPQNGPVECPPEWRWTRADGVAASRAVTLAARREFTVVLLGAKFQKVATGLSNVAPGGAFGAWIILNPPERPNLITNWWCNVGAFEDRNAVPFRPLEGAFSDRFRPFAGLPAGAAFDERISLQDVVGVQRIGLLTRAKVDNRYRVPTAGLIDPVFAPVNERDPDAGGLGLVKGYVYAQRAAAFGPATERTCMQWEGS